MSSSSASAYRWAGVARLRASSPWRSFFAVAASAVSMRAPATGSKVPNSLYMPSDSFLMFASRRARWRRRRSSRPSPADRSLTWSRTVWPNTSAGSFTAAASKAASSTGVCAEASAIARACWGVIAPSASASAVPGRSPSRSANCTSRLAAPRDCFKSPRSTSAACASPRQRASSVTLSAFTAARRASQRPTTRKHSSTRSPARARNPTTSTSNSPNRSPDEGSPAAGALGNEVACGSGGSSKPNDSAETGAPAARMPVGAVPGVVSPRTTPATASSICPRAACSPATGVACGSGGSSKPDDSAETGAPAAGTLASAVPGVVSPRTTPATASSISSRAACSPATGRVAVV